MKEKLKKIDFKHLFIVFLITLLIGFCVLAICLLNKYDENYSKTILNKNDDLITLNESYFLNDDGNIMSDNILNPSYILLQYTTNNDGLPVISNTNNRAVTNYLPISPDTTYTITCSNNLFIRELNFASSIGSGLGYNVINATSYTFTTPSNANYLIILFGIGNEPDTYKITLNDIVPNCMFNFGSASLPYEPFKIWYNELKYFYFDNKTASIYNYSNNNYLTSFTLSQNTYVDYVIDFTDVIESIPNYDDINFFNVVIPINLLSSDFFCNAIFPVSTVDGEFKVNYDDGSSYLVDSYSLNREFHIYNGLITNPSKFIKNISFLIHYDSILTILFNLSPSYIQYQNGYNSAYFNNQSLIDNLNNQISTLNENYNSLNSDYISLQQQYNELASGQYTFSELFWSISAVPFGVLTSAFNVNVLGVNLALNNYGFIHLYASNLVI